MEKNWWWLNVVNFTLLQYVMSQRSCGFLITKELIFGFQILDLKVHFSASLTRMLDIFVKIFGMPNKKIHVENADFSH